MTLYIEVPADDAELIAKIEGIPGVRALSEHQHSGRRRNIRRYAVEIAALVGVATTLSGGVKTVFKDLGEAKEALISIFDQGVQKHQGNPNADFRVEHKDVGMLLSTQASPADLEKQQEKLRTTDDWISTPPSSGPRK